MPSNRLEAPDQINVVLTETWVNAGTGNDVVTSTVEGANKFALGGGNDTYTNEDGFARTRRFDEVFGGAGNDTDLPDPLERISRRRRQRLHVVGRLQQHHVGWQGPRHRGYMEQNDSPLSGWGVDIDLGREFARTGQGHKERIFDFENAEGTSYGDGIVGSARNNSLF